MDQDQKTDTSSQQGKRGDLFSPLRARGILLILLLILSGCGARPNIYEGGVKLDPGQKRLADWHVLMREHRELPEREKLTLVNDFFNQLEFVDDLTHWGKDDYWATPQEMLVSGGGDCEDFATAKYFTLRQLDVANEKLRLIYVKSLSLNQPHMVLGYYPEPTADPLILDNLVKKILFASERTDLLPVYSFNAQGLWVIKEQGSEPAGRADRLSLWRELQSRFIDEVFTPPSKTGLNTLIHSEYTH
jgi:predicted transglutaminase-like cysteine proteinase